MNRIEVKYTKIGGNVSRTLLHQTRWLDARHGLLYRDKGDRTSTNDGFKPDGMAGHLRIWTNSFGVEVQEVQAAPAPTATPASGYPDGNPKSVQGAKKLPLRLLPLPANIAVNQALEDGCKKYGAANWRKTGVAASVYVDAALRHLFQWFDGGQDNAADSGVHNLGHAMACLAILVDAQANGSLIDDRPDACNDTDSLLLRAKAL